MRHSKKRGNSLAEVIVASALTMLVVRLVLAPLHESQRSAAQAQGRLQALRLATDVVERQRQRPNLRNETWTGAGQAETIVDGVARQQEYLYSVRSEEVAGGEFQVEVGVQWDEGGQRRRLDYGTRLPQRAP